ncbi:MAG: ATP-binding protein [Gallionella sp.]|nr:ATP-binding protein [Gallionella sp.]MDD4959679.1 ATP-binding protein [Gallionella sp.]
MSEQKLPLTSFALGGYRSFGDVQRFEQLAKINLLIGQNNCGKSNVLRFLRDVFFNKIDLGVLDKHLSLGKPFIIGWAIPPAVVWDESEYAEAKNIAEKIFRKRIELDKTEKVWFYLDESRASITRYWNSTFQATDESSINLFTDQELLVLMEKLSSLSSSFGVAPPPRETVINQLIKIYLIKLARQPATIRPILIPAIRQIGKPDSISEEFNGEGIINRLAKLERPDDHLNQTDRVNFGKIQTFLRNVIDNKTATIEIPHGRETIHVKIDDKILPLESLGTGIHEVIILATAATILENTVICMEEPELHLNPLLQKKLVRYLQSTSNQYFITTHSAALMDTPDAEIYHIRMENGQSIVERATMDSTRSEICRDLGYHPSDFLQSNCVIWVEGPSDRIYLNYWIRNKDSSLAEGIDYSIMFYGGALIAHLSAKEISEEPDSEEETGEKLMSEEPDFEEETGEKLTKNTLIFLPHLNRRSYIVMDSDKKSPDTELKPAVSKLVEQFGKEFSWVTKGREMENYLPCTHIEDAIKKVNPNTKYTFFGVESNPTDYDRLLTIERKKSTAKTQSSSKVGIAHHIVDKYPADFSRLDLKEQVGKLVAFIKDSNP